jgi:hypothetical protein
MHVLKSGLNKFLFEFGFTSSIVMGKDHFDTAHLLHRRNLAERSQHRNLTQQDDG